MERTKLRAILNISALVMTLIINALANIIPFNGLTTGEISDMYPVEFVPAGYVFSIWSLIYLALGAFVIYQALPKYRDNQWVERVGWLFIVTCVLNSLWMFAWHYQQLAISVIIMLGFLGTLITMYRRLNIGRESIDLRNKWLVQIPFSIYLGWISVATIANITTFLYALGWRGDPLSESAWAVVLLVVGVVLTAVMALRHRDVAYGLVILWAYVGIYVKQTDLTAIAAIALAVVVGMFVIVAFFRSAPRLKPRLS